MLDGLQGLNKKGTLTDGENKSLVKEWHDKRTEAEFNHCFVVMCIHIVACITDRDLTYH